MFLWVKKQEWGQGGFEAKRPFRIQAAGHFLLDQKHKQCCLTCRRPLD